MRIHRLLVLMPRPRMNLLIGCLLLGLTAQATSAEGGMTAEQDAEMTRTMNVLAEEAMQIGLRAISESGAVYPFALLSRGGESRQLMSFQGEREEAPSPDEWTATLFQRLAHLAKDDGGVQSVAVVRLHEVVSQEGETVHGLWTHVEQRGAQPWVVFLPFLRNEAGRHDMGELVYHASAQHIFPQAVGAEQQGR